MTDPEVQHLARLLERAHSENSERLYPWLMVAEYLLAHGVHLHEAGSERRQIEAQRHRPIVNNSATGLKCICGEWNDCHGETFVDHVVAKLDAPFSPETEGGET